MYNSDIYSTMIKKIKSKQRIIVAITVVLVLVTLIACLPFHVSLFDKTVIDRDGLHPILTFLIIILILFCELIAYAFILIPMTNSMMAECDPEKHLALNIALNKEKNLDHVYAMDLFYLGNYAGALNCADRMVKSKKSTTVLSGLFYKARCEYFLGYSDALRATTDQYEQYLASIGKLSEKQKAAFVKMLLPLKLMVALSENSTEEIKKYADFEPWNAHKPTEGFTNYLKGIAALSLNDKKEAIFLLMSAKEILCKTALAELAEKQLENL